MLYIDRQIWNPDGHIGEIYAVCVFRVIFGDIGFNPGSVEQEHRSQIAIHFLADRFRDVNETVKYGLQIRNEVLFKPG